MITRTKLTDIDIAKINRKYKCSPDKFSLGDHIPNAIPYDGFKIIKENQEIENHKKEEEKEVEYSINYNPKTLGIWENG